MLWNSDAESTPVPSASARLNISVSSASICCSAASSEMAIAPSSAPIAPSSRFDCSSSLPSFFMSSFRCFSLSSESRCLNANAMNSTLSIVPSPLVSAVAISAPICPLLSPSSMLFMHASNSSASSSPLLSASNLSNISTRSAWTCSSVRPPR